MCDDASDDIEPNHILIPVKIKLSLVCSFLFMFFFQFD